MVLTKNSLLVIRQIKKNKHYVLEDKCSIYEINYELNKLDEDIDELNELSDDIREEIETNFCEAEVVVDKTEIKNTEEVDVKQKTQADELLLVLESFNIFISTSSFLNLSSFKPFSIASVDVFPSKTCTSPILFFLLTNFIYI